MGSRLVDDVKKRKEKKNNNKYFFVFVRLLPPFKDGPFTPIYSNVIQCIVMV